MSSSANPSNTTKTSFSPAIYGLLALGMFLVYWPSLQGGFLFDDQALVVDNYQIHTLDAFADPSGWWA